MGREIRSKHETSVELEDDSIASNLPNDMATVNELTKRANRGLVRIGKDGSFGYYECR